MRLGRLEVHILHESTFWLDGGQMFGLVPRVFWEREVQPDPGNRVPLGVHPLLVKSGNTKCRREKSAGEKNTNQKTGREEISCELALQHLRPPANRRR